MSLAGVPMRTRDELMLELRIEIVRLGGIVEAARLSGRDVSLQKAFIDAHCLTLALLEMGLDPETDVPA